MRMHAAGAEADETSTKVRMELSGVRVRGHNTGVQAGEARWSRHARRAVRIRGGAPDVVLSVRGGGGCRPTSAPMGKGGRGIGATKMDRWMRARGAWGSMYASDVGARTVVHTRTLSPGQGRAPGVSRVTRAYNSAHSGLARCRARMPVGVGARRAL
jgi:hypothetical protein